MGSTRADEILDGLRWLGLSPEGHRKTAPPEVTPLGENEERAIRAAILATERGLDPSRILHAEWTAERLFQTAKDRSAGRLGAVSLEMFPAVFRNCPGALDSHRVRRLFHAWIKFCPDRQARLALRRLRGRRVTLADLDRRELAHAANIRVRGFQAAGLTKAEAVAAEARAERVPDSLATKAGLVPDRQASGRTTVGRVLTLLRLADKLNHEPPTVATHRRPRRRPAQE